MRRMVAAILTMALVGCSGGNDHSSSSGGGGAPPGGGGPGGGDPTQPWTTGSYYPAWQNVAATNVINFNYNSGVTSQQNGANLKAAIAALNAGDEIRIGPGTYSVNSFWNVIIQGTAAAPIWITAQNPANKPVITRPDNNQNVMNIASGGGNLTEYVCFRNLDFTGGDDLIRIYNGRQLWIDQCYIHDGDGVGISANTADTEYLYITRNEIDQPGNAGDTAEGMYLGANNSAVRMRYSIIALNHVHDTYGTTQGDGIEVKQGSYNNWIVENNVHDTNYPCIIAYGTDGLGINVIERNTMYNCNDNVLQVQGEAIVRNNLIMNGNQGFQSHDHQGQTVNLTFVHNTIINSGRGANMPSWNNRAGMVFANNAVYSQNQESIRFTGGSNGVTITGNVVLGPVTGASSGYVGGIGLGDYVNVSWNAANQNATPSSGSPLIGAGNPAHAVTEDLNGNTRSGPLCSGAVDAP